MNRSQRCGVCSGCQAKPCGQCVYCQDSPQFGGPGVKKQSCLERRCLRVLENRLQRDAPTFKAKGGCNTCEDCRTLDCQVCLVCLDKKFFQNRYMPGAMCAKKRCNQARNIDLPSTNGFAPQNGEPLGQRQTHDPNFAAFGSPMIHKRPAMPGLDDLPRKQPRPLQPAMSALAVHAQPMMSAVGGALKMQMHHPHQMPPPPTGSFTLVPLPVLGMQPTPHNNNNPHFITAYAQNPKLLAAAAPFNPVLSRDAHIVHALHGDDPDKPREYQLAHLTFANPTTIALDTSPYLMASAQSTTINGATSWTAEDDGSQTNLDLPPSFHHGSNVILQQL